MKITGDPKKNIFNFVYQKKMSDKKIEEKEVISDLEEESVSPWTTEKISITDLAKNPKMKRLYENLSDDNKQNLKFGKKISFVDNSELNEQHAVTINEESCTQNTASLLDFKLDVLLAKNVIISLILTMAVSMHSIEMGFNLGYAKDSNILYKTYNKILCLRWIDSFLFVYILKRYNFPVYLLIFSQILFNFSQLIGVILGCVMGDVEVRSNFYLGFSECFFCAAYLYIGVCDLLNQEHYISEKNKTEHIFTLLGFILIPLVESLL